MAKPVLPGFALVSKTASTEAIARGDFDNLPGAGKPLELDDTRSCRKRRIAFRIRKNAGFIPPQVERLAELERLARERGRSRSCKTAATGAACVR